jgi:hypothetical protein
VRRADPQQKAGWKRELSVTLVLSALLVTMYPAASRTEQGGVFLGPSRLAIPLRFRVVERLQRLAKKAARALPHAVRRGVTIGTCPICDGTTLFIKEGDWLRDQLLCIRCRSIPRWRALIFVLETFFPGWREMSIHESSPGGPASYKLSREAREYCPTHLFPDTQPGAYKDGIRCEDLERQTFPDESFDLVVSQDVFEHVFEPARGFAEVARTLRAGGAHVFTIPWYYWKPTEVRAERVGNEIKYLRDPEYHGNPISEGGSLVVTEWGEDFCDYVQRSSGLTTTAVWIRDPKRGIDGKFREVFISRKFDKSTSTLEA